MDKQGHTYSAGNYIQYPVINRNEKNMKKNIYIYIYIYMYNWVKLGRTAEINTTLCINYTSVKLKQIRSISCWESSSSTLLIVISSNFEVISL